MNLRWILLVAAAVGVTVMLFRTGSDGPRPVPPATGETSGEQPAAPKAAPVATVVAPRLSAALPVVPTPVVIADEHVASMFAAPIPLSPLILATGTVPQPPSTKVPFQPSGGQVVAEMKPAHEPAGPIAEPTQTAAAVDGAGVVPSELDFKTVAPETPLPSPAGNDAPTVENSTEPRKLNIVLANTETDASHGGPHPRGTKESSVSDALSRNPSDRVETRVVRLYYFRDAHRVAEIVNRDVKSHNDSRQCSISVIGEGILQLRGPIKGMNVIRNMISQIDAPVGQVRIAFHTAQVNGEHMDRMEKVVDGIPKYIDHSRFLTSQSGQMLGKAIALVAGRKAKQAYATAPYTSQAEREQTCLQAFFGQDFIQELQTLDAECFRTGNKLLSLHSLDSTSLSSALVLLAFANNSTRHEILAEFARMTAHDLPAAERAYVETAGPTRDGKKLPLLAGNARFPTLRGFFNAEFRGAETMTPIQREFARLAQILKSQAATELEVKQRVLERAIIETAADNRLKLDGQKLLDMLIDEVEEKSIALLESARAHTANVDSYVKSISTALDDDFQTQFYLKALRGLRESSNPWDVNFGPFETTSVLANNRGSATGALAGQEREKGRRDGETGAGYEIRPVIGPDGRAVAFRFQYLSSAIARDSVRANEKPPVKQHFIDTDVQLDNYDLREISRYLVTLKVARTGRGASVLQDIPGVGVLFRQSPGTDSSLQQNIILSQATIFPTLFDVMGLRWLPSGDLDRTKQPSLAFQALKSRADAFTSARLDEFLRAPAERRTDFPIVNASGNVPLREAASVHSESPVIMPVSADIEHHAGKPVVSSEVTPAMPGPPAGQSGGLPRPVSSKGDSKMNGPDEAGKWLWVPASPLTAPPAVAPRPLTATVPIAVLPVPVGKNATRPATPKEPTRVVPTLPAPAVSLVWTTPANSIPNYRQPISGPVLVPVEPNVGR